MKQLSGQDAMFIQNSMVMIHSSSINGGVGGDGGGRASGRADGAAITWRPLGPRSSVG